MASQIVESHAILPMCPAAEAGEHRGVAMPERLHYLFVCLDVPDIYERDEPELVRTLEQKLYEHLMQEGLI